MIAEDILAFLARLAEGLGGYNGRKVEVRGLAGRESVGERGNCGQHGVSR
jgi:hypothetical protein